MPPAQQSTILAMLSEPTGGFRPIGFYQGLFRVWEKARPKFVRRWKDAHGNHPVFPGSRCSSRHGVKAGCFEARQARHTRAALLPCSRNSRNATRCLRIWISGPIPVRCSAHSALSRCHAGSEEKMLVFPDRGVVAGCIFTTAASTRFWSSRWTITRCVPSPSILRCSSATWALTRQANKTMWQSETSESHFLLEIPFVICSQWVRLCFGPCLCLSRSLRLSFSCAGPCRSCSRKISGQEWLVMAFKRREGVRGSRVKNVQKSLGECGLDWWAEGVDV